MSSEPCANCSKMEGIISPNFVFSCVISNENSPIVEGKNAKRFSQSSTSTFDHRPNSIGPVTPDSNRESAEQILDFPCQDMLVSSPPSVTCFDLNDSGSQTPKDCIFDPFAPGHDEFMLAPRKKCMKEFRNNIVRRLGFSSITSLISSRNQEDRDDTISEEEQLFDIVYNTLLDVIILDQTKEFASKSLAQVSDSDGFWTPKFTACLGGIAETCPGAPKKCTRGYRKIDRELCRKLKF